MSSYGIRMHVVADLIGCGITRAYQLSVQPGFPRPRVVRGRTKYYARAEILAWKKARIDRRRGRWTRKRSK